MFEGPSDYSPALQQLHDRYRRIAQRIGLAGLVLVGLALGLTGLFGRISFNSYVEAGNYALILAGLALAARRDFHIRSVMNGGLAALFLCYWAHVFVEVQSGDINVTTLIYPLFIPVFIAIGLDYRLQLALAPLQAVFIWFCTVAFTEAYPLGGPGLSDERMLAGSLAAFSAILLVLLAMVQISRQRTDQRLVQVITEKEHLATTDPLTGLLNRRAFLAALKTAADETGEVTAVFIDLNNFKPLNDQYGHAAGDAVLRAIAARLERSDAIAVAARPGGDEFAAIAAPCRNAAEMDAALAGLYAELVCDVAWNGRLIHVGASMGYAHKGRDDKSLTACLSEADTAMRRVKAAGGGYARFAPEVDGEAIETELMQVTFPRALASGLIRPALQPIADAGTMEIVGHELLARWTGLAQADINSRQPGPEEFIPVAEKLGLLNELLWTTLDTTLSNWKSEPKALSVNISPGQLQTTDFIPTLRRVLDKHRFPANGVTLEITERVALRNLEANVGMLQRARKAGLSIALDDFGTGYSSLSMLTRLPLDKLKIDRSLTLAAATAEDAPENALLRGALRLARDLGLVTCVEGISSETLAEKMRKLGADQMQGYWIGQPRLVESPDEKPARLAC
ncbi:MAG: hypothetical protein CME84_02245 [Henriciella sp.]|jgi:diguanylate cyclase (GGDEF)-like protein|uniref:putative bifunctional diguanylate cyclase/phosphodiesterase n=1 Tax=Henriciella sp. TaxID=1968823 RepID=UPI000C10FDEC|nr:bifunctional diguanylate cyclase/phosphodiesterase [Henriciella sp.]MAN72900.1 hypothetical protein [Henriciella sp.]MBF33234.1 hypothetical protein [Hyphomonadaceae bacterium]PHR78179.1 MAG: hypothetical protein COA64_08240 [Henriciella sp.]|tara:strand:- start:6444 stop:8318 length:1875 start_codon:yes stop_codon:yes gene_type:complete